MKNTRLIRLKRNRYCQITKVSFPKNTILYAEHIVKDVWHINNYYVSLSVIEHEDFDFVLN